MRILVTGASGLLGRKVFTQLKLKDYQVFGTCGTKPISGLLHVDLTLPKTLGAIIHKIRPTALIHCAAMTDVNACEENVDLARSINVEATATLSRICKKMDIYMVYVSSDYVFSGYNSPYIESDQADPINVYGRTKREGEEAVTAAGVFASIVRPTIMDGYNGPEDKFTFTRDLLRNLKETPNSVVLDNCRKKYPILIDDVAENIELLINQRRTGIFHFSSKAPVTRYEWGLIVGSTFGFAEEQIRPDDNIDIHRFPPRPVDVKLVDTQMGFNFREVQSLVSIIKQQIERRQ